MKVYLQHITTRRYYRARGEWVANRADAKAFALGVDAASVAKDEGLSNVQLLIRFKNRRKDFRVPIPPPPPKA